MEALRRGILAFLFSPYNLLLLLWSGICSGVYTGTRKTGVSLAVLAWQSLWKATLLYSSVASEEEWKSGRGFNGGELDINLGCHQVYPRW